MMVPRKRVFTCLGLLVLGGAAITVAAPAATGTARAIAKPVIGQPTTVPNQAVAGKRLVVSYKVTRSDNGKPLMTGRMICNPSTAGKVIAHTESFRGGTARLSFVVPPTATRLRVKVTIKSGIQSATRISTFAVKQAVKPTISITDASVTEGSAGTATLSFPVSLSTASAQTVSVAYATSDGSATAPNDYTAASGTVTFAPGEMAKAVAVSVVGDTAIEPNETMTATLSNPVGATIADSSATGTITNDDTQVPVTAGEWKGQMQTGDYLYFHVSADRKLSYFRVNSVRETCDQYGYIQGAISWNPSLQWPLGNDGLFTREYNWTGSESQGDITWTSEYYKIIGHFNGGSATGTFVLKDGLTYKGTNLSCSTGDLTWTASPS